MHMLTILHVEYQNLRIWRKTWLILGKIKALLLMKESKAESLVEIVHRLAEAELKRLESHKN
jgi:hypothetical protein